MLYLTVTEELPDTIRSDYYESIIIFNLKVFYFYEKIQVKLFLCE